jgi:hypothetical protein
MAGVKMKRVCVRWGGGGGGEIGQNRWLHYFYKLRPHRSMVLRSSMKDE